MQPLVVLYVVALPMLQFELFRLGGKSVAPTDVAFAVLFVYVLAARAWRRPSPGIVAAALLPVIAVLVVVAWTQVGIAIGGPEVFRTTYSMATLILFASLPLDQQRAERAAASWVITSCCVCLVGLVAWIGVIAAGLPKTLLAGADSTNLGAVRLGSVLGPNALSLYLVVSFAMVAALAAGAQAARKTYYVTALVVLALSAALTLSRGIVGFALMCALWAFKRDLAPAWLHRLRWGVALVALSLITAGVLFTLWVYPFQLRADQRVSMGGARPSAYRVLHAAGLRMWAAHPVFGVGVGSFGARLEEYTDAEERTRCWPPLDSSQNRSPHSTWIGLAAEGGAVLLLSWVATCIVLARRLHRASSAVPLASYLGLAFAGTVFNGLHVELIHLKFIWASLGLVYAIHPADTD